MHKMSRNIFKRYTLQGLVWSWVWAVGGRRLVLGVRVWKHPVISLYAYIYEGFLCFFVLFFM